jgi:predicted ATP-dependent endonuclease of OLD family
MLKAIELAGFKSFADRTRLEFGDGITAIVGPTRSFFPMLMKSCSVLFRLKKWT